MPSQHKRHVPGPGAYPAYDTIAPKRKYLISKFRNSQASTFAPPRSARFSPSKEGKAPGPGSYELNTAIEPLGEYFISKFKDSMARTFGNGPRNTTAQLSIKNVPGPGSYRLPSEFGHYESARGQQSERGQQTDRGQLSARELPEVKSAAKVEAKSPQKKTTKV